MNKLIVTEPNILNIEKLENSVIMELRLQPELDYFKGHFPEVPILAGVVQLDWAIQYIQQHLGYEQQLVENVEVLKFQVVLSPDLVVSLHLERKSAHKATFKYISAKGVHASGRIVFENS
ncbi:MAG: thioester dehydrase [Thalassotalea sp.]